MCRADAGPVDRVQMSKGDNPKLARRDFLLLLLDSASEASEQDFRTVTCVVPKPSAIGRRDDLFALHKERCLTGEHVRLNTRAPELVDGQYHLDFEGDESRVQLPSPMNFVLQDETGVARLQVRVCGGAGGMACVMTLVCLRRWARCRLACTRWTSSGPCRASRRSLWRWRRLM